MRLVAATARAAAHRLHLRAPVPDAARRPALADRLSWSATPIRTRASATRRTSCMHEVDQVLALAERAGATEVAARPARSSITDADRAAVADLPPDPVIVHLGRRWTRARQHDREPARALPRSCAPLGRPLVATYGADARRTGRTPSATAGVADLVAGGLTLRPLGGGLRARGLHRHDRYRCDPRRERGAAADGRSLRARATSGSTRRNGRRTGCRTPSCANPRPMRRTPSRRRAPRSSRRLRTCYDRPLRHLRRRSDVQSPRHAALRHPGAAWRKICAPTRSR